MDANTMSDIVRLKAGGSGINLNNFDDREMSAFLNEAQDILVMQRVTPDANVKGKGFEFDAKRRLDVVGVITAHTRFKRVGSGGVPGDFMIGTEDNGMLPSPDRDYQVESIGATASSSEVGYGVFVRLPDECLFVISERCNTSKNGEIRRNVPVEVVSYDEYAEGINNTFKAPFKNKVWRMDWGSYTTSGTSGSITSSKFTGDILTGFTGTNADNVSGNITINTHRSVMLIPGKDYTIESYNLGYIKSPRHMVVDMILPSAQVSCELNPKVHNEIVDIAVSLLIESRIPEQSKYQVVKNKETRNE